MYCVCQLKNILKSLLIWVYVLLFCGFLFLVYLGGPIFGLLGALLGVFLGIFVNMYNLWHFGGSLLRFVWTVLDFLCAYFVALFSGYFTF